MAYSIPLEHPLGSIALEYDQLDYSLRRNEKTRIESICASIRGDPAASSERRLVVQLFEGLVALADGRHEAGRKDLRAALGGPQYVRIHAASALVAQEVMDGNLEAAAEILQPLIAQDPPSAHFHTSLGMYLGRNGDTEGEWKSYLRALQLRPNHLPALWAMRAVGLAPERRQEFKDALLGFLGDEPENGNVRAYLAACLLTLGEPEQAWAEIQRIVAFIEVAPVTDDTLEILRKLTGALSNIDGETRG